MHPLSAQSFCIMKYIESFAIGDSYSLGHIGGANEGSTLDIPLPMHKHCQSTSQLAAVTFCAVAGAGPSAILEAEIYSETRLAKVWVCMLEL